MYMEGHLFSHCRQKKTISSEKAAELLLECLNVIKEYKDNLLESEIKGGDKPTLPIIITAFNVKTTDNYLLEIIKTIRSRQIEFTRIISFYNSYYLYNELKVKLI